MSKSHRGALVSLVLAGALVPAPAIATPRTDGPQRATSTHVGQSLIAETAQRWRDNGLSAQSSALEAWLLGDGSYLVAPEGAPLSDSGIPETDAEPSSDASFALAMVEVAAGPDWQLAAQNCFARYYYAGAWQDMCYQVHRLVNDGNGSYDYFTLNHSATMKSVDSAYDRYYLTSGWIEAYRLSGTSAQYWVDWDPASDQSTGSCSTISLGVSAVIMAYFSGTICPDRWDITKYADAGHFKNKWLGTAYDAERAVEYVIAVKTAQGGWPQWVLPHGVTYELWD